MRSDTKRYIGTLYRAASDLLYEARHYYTRPAQVEYALEQVSKIRAQIKIMRKRGY